MGIEPLGAFSDSNHTACRFAEEMRFFRSLWAGGAVPPLRALPFSLAKRAQNAAPFFPPEHAAGRNARLFPCSTKDDQG